MKFALALIALIPSFTALSASAENLCSAQNLGQNLSDTWVRVEPADNAKMGEYDQVEKAFALIAGRLVSTTTINLGDDLSSTHGPYFESLSRATLTVSAQADEKTCIVKNEVRYERSQAKRPFGEPGESAPEVIKTYAENEKVVYSRITFSSLNRIEIETCMNQGCSITRGSESYTRKSN